jgi:sialic acid synthase SpsE
MAEVGVNHDGEEEKGVRLVEEAARATCEGVKFQLFRAELLLAREARLVGYQRKHVGGARGGGGQPEGCTPNNVGAAGGGQPEGCTPNGVDGADGGRDARGTAGELLKGLEMPVEVMGRLVKRAQGLGMAAVVTPFSVELVEACVGMGVDAIKLASPDLVNRPLVEAACGTGLPVILSTGAAELSEVERTVGWLWQLGAAGGDGGGRAVILHCVSGYPTPAERATLGAIGVLRQRFGEMPVGYSDHTVETFTAALAVGCGACVLEKHLTLDKRGAGPDHAASLEPGEMAEYCALARIGYVMRGPFVKQVLAEEREVREQTRQSVVARVDLKVGTVLAREMLCVKRPGTGVPAAEMERVVGRVLVREVKGNSVVRWEDVGGQVVSNE